MYFPAVFYSLLKIYARFAIKIYCRKIVINHPAVLRYKGPLLLAANHPNSFLDGMILTTLFEERVFSLARGDVFKQKRIDRFLRSLQLLPVFRTSEGVENLEHNYTTFEACRKTFEGRGNVLIFSEGRCENEWKLRPLKKGTARLAITSWEKDIPLLVIPTAFNYSSFKRFGKEVHLYFGTPLSREKIMSGDTEGKRLVAFNDSLREQLEPLVYNIAPHDKARVRNIFSIRLKPSFFLLLLPALAGCILHAPLFFPCKLFTRAKFRNSGHYDSVLTSLILLLYPVYLLLVLFIGYALIDAYTFFLLILLPFTAWACVQAKYQLGW